MAAEFTIDGNPYPVVSIRDLEIDEGQYLYDRTGILIEDFVRNEGETEREWEDRLRAARTPKFWGVFMCIAYKRKHPDLSDEEAWKVIGRQNLLEARRVMLEDDEDDASPPELTPQPEQSSENSTGSEPPTTGSGSSGSSTEQAVQQEITGTSESDTSSTSAPLTSVA